MLVKDFMRLTGTSLLAHKMRSFLTMLGISVGIAAVVLLTSIGEGIHQFVLKEFTQFGTTIVAINPGKKNTHGMATGVFGSTRPLTIEDVQALKRLPFAKSVVGFVQGNAEVEGNNRSRRTTIYGAGHDFPEAFSMPVKVGRFLPPDDPIAPRAFAVLGHKVKNELFGNSNPLGHRIRIGGNRYRIIGVMESKGQMLGFDLDDAAYIPTHKAMSLFNRESLMEVDLLYAPGTDSEALSERIRTLLTQRHGNEDFTIITQDQMLETLGSVLDILTLAVAALGGISLLVGGVGILTIMTISVGERTGEVGLLRALGAGRWQVLWLFLGEALVLSALGGLAGLLLGAGGAWLLGVALPALPTHTPFEYLLLAEGIAAGIGLLAGVAPAWRAARLDPIEALRAE